MTCFNSECVSHSDFERIAFYARKRFVEGVDTITLMVQARDDLEKREIALAALLDLDDDCIRNLNLFSCSNQACTAGSYRPKLQQMLTEIRPQIPSF